MHNNYGVLMNSEIEEQPAVIERLLAEKQGMIAEIAAKFRAVSPYAVFFAARGTSDHAALYAKYLFETVAGLPTGLSAPSVFSTYHANLNMKNCLVIGISQSGAAEDVVEVLAGAKRGGAQTIAITNCAGSILDEVADDTILLGAEKERAVAATKTYTASLAVLAMLVAEIADSNDLREALKLVPDAINSVITNKQTIQDNAIRFRYLEECVVLGRGYNLSTANELALKLRETTYVRAQPFATPDFVHGPIAIIDRGYPVIAHAAEGPTLESVMEVVHTSKKRGGEAVVISNSRSALNDADVAIPVCVDMNLPEWMTPFPFITAGQFFARSLAILRGNNPDEPRGLSKVTVTR